MSVAIFPTAEGGMIPDIEKSSMFQGGIPNMTNGKHTQTDVNDSETSGSADTPLTGARSGFDLAIARNMLKAMRPKAAAIPYVKILRKQLSNLAKFEARGDDTADLRKLIMASVKEIARRNQ